MCGRKTRKKGDLFGLIGKLGVRQYLDLIAEQDAFGWQTNFVTYFFTHQFVVAGEYLGGYAV